MYLSILTFLFECCFSFFCSHTCLEMASS